jgi:hypothetical protein
VFAKVLGNRFVLTNPSFYTPLDENEIIVVIGNVKKMKFEQTSVDHNNEDKNRTHHGNRTQNSNYFQSKAENNSLQTKDIDRIMEELDNNQLLSIRDIDSENARKRIEMKKELIDELHRMYNFKSNF